MKSAFILTAAIASFGCQLALADTSWRGVITAVEASEKLDGTHIQTYQGLGGAVAMGKAAWDGGGFLKQAAAFVVGEVAGAQVERASGGEMVKCTKLTFKLDSGEVGDQCLTRWDMSSDYVVGARIILSADRSGNIRVKSE